MTHGFAHQSFARDDDGVTVITFTCSCGVIVGPLGADAVAEAWTDHLREQ